MKSYSVIDRIERNFAVCEVELVSVEESLNLDISEKETLMMDIELDVITQICGNIQEGDIIIVEHNSNCVYNVYEKDEEEKQRRIQLLEKIIKN